MVRYLCRYFGFITKHPADERFACHVFVSENSTKPLAESVRSVLFSFALCSRGVSLCSSSYESILFNSPSIFSVFIHRKAFHLYYKEFVEVSCPTEDIYLE